MKGFLTHGVMLREKKREGLIRKKRGEEEKIFLKVVELL